MNYSMQLYTKLLKYWHIVIISWHSRLVDIVNVVGELPLIALHLWILTQLYTVTYQAIDTTDPETMSLASIIWILMIINCFGNAMYPTISSLIDAEIKNGSFAYSITKPYSYVLFQYSSFLGRTLPCIVLNLAVGITVAYILVGPITVTGTSFSLGMFLMFLGYTLDFSIELIIGLLGFWIEDTSSLSFMYRNIIQILGGSIIPLSLYPEPLKYIAELLPFSQLFYAPAELLVNFSSGTFHQVLITQAGWLFTTGLIAFILFNQGMKYVSRSGQ